MAAYTDPGGYPGQDISLRPSVVDEKNRFGVFEIDTITASNGKELARHKEIAKGLDAEFYLAPHTTLGSGVQTRTQTG